MLIHQFDHVTGQYISSRLADADPRCDGRWLVPAFCTADALPERAPLTWPFYRSGAWVLLPDYRGRLLYRTDNGEPAEILVAGMTPGESGLTETPRPSDRHVWLDGTWTLDPETLARDKQQAAMAEFERLLTRAQRINAGKADAYAAGLLSKEEIYYFRRWSAYQLDLVRVIQRADFPDNVEWPDEPALYQPLLEAAMAEYKARLEKAHAQLEGKAEGFAAGTLTNEDFYTFTAWTAYVEALERATAHDTFPDAMTWPDEPAPYMPPVVPPVVPPTAPRAAAFASKTAANAIDATDATDAETPAMNAPPGQPGRDVTDPVEKASPSTDAFSRQQESA
jgi:hypothetical protein